MYSEFTKNDDSDLIKRGASMSIPRVLIFIIAIVVLRNEGVIAQIPAKGSDFPTLTGLHWGITMQAVRDHFIGKRELETTTSSVLSYKDTLLNVKMEIYLIFIEKDSLLILNSVEACLDEPDEDVLEIIEKYFMNSYGNKYEYNKDRGLKNNIDTEIKLWRLNDESVELKVLTFKGKKLVTLNIKYKSPKPKYQGPIVQIPVKGSDFSTLASLQWGITMQAASKSISGKRNILRTTSSEFSYEDTLLNANANITLKFDDCDSLSILNVIEAEFTDPNKELLQLLEKRMIEHYGNEYKTKKESKSKFFYTINFVARTWRLDNESIGLMTMSHRDEVKSINLMYKYVYAKQ